jgi:hypothetical protein
MFYRFRYKNQTSSLSARMARTRREGCLRGALEAKPFQLAVAGPYERQQALDWLNTAIDAGRAELEVQHALEREMDAWDMSCRIMFMVAITHGQDARLQRLCTKRGAQ